MNKPKSVYETYKLFLLLFTIVLPVTAGLCLLLSILVFSLVSSIWWVGLLFLALGLAALGVWWSIRNFIRDCMKEERKQEELRAAREADNAPEEAEETAFEKVSPAETAEEIPAEGIPQAAEEPEDKE